MLRTGRKSKIHFFYTHKGYYFRESGRLKKLIEQIFLRERKKLGSLNYIFCSDNDLLVINKRYLNHHYYTDIVTFDLSDKKEIIVGETYISIDRVKANAARLNISLRNEFLRVVFHGALHLCGYNDKNQRDTLIMRKKEDYYLSLYLSH